MTFEVELVETGMMKTALRGLRRPMNKEPKGNDTPDEADLRLFSTLRGKGDDHAKVLRMVMVGVTIKAPRYWWIEFDTYKLGRFDCDEEHTSQSSMHYKMTEPFVREDFEEMSNAWYYPDDLKQINEAREAYVEEIISLYQFKADMPESLLQTRDIVLNYQALRHIYQGRRNHKLPHWVKFCEFIETLPYAKEMICGEAQ